MKNYRDDILCHYGIKGMKRGRRRFQNEDGSLTAAGRARYLEGNKSTGMSGVVGGTAKTVSGMYANARNAISKTAAEANRRRMAASGPSSASRVDPSLSKQSDEKGGGHWKSRFSRNDDGSITADVKYPNKFYAKRNNYEVAARIPKYDVDEHGNVIGYEYGTARSVRREGDKLVEYDDKGHKLRVLTPESHAVIKNGYDITTRAGQDRQAGTSYGAARNAENARRKEEDASRQAELQRLQRAEQDYQAGTSYGVARSAEDARRNQAAEAAAYQQQRQTETRRAQERRAGMGMNAAMAASKQKEKDYRASTHKPTSGAQAAVNASRSKPASSLGTALNNLKRKLDTAAAQKKADDEKKKRQRSGRRGSYYGG